MALSARGPLTLEAVEQAVGNLEAMLAEVESMSAVLDFDSGQFKDTLRIANTGVAKLASEVAEDLRIWREHQEQEHERHQQELVERLRRTVENRREEVTDRQHVREEIRKGLVEHARKALSRGSDLCFSQMEYHEHDEHHHTHAPPLEADESMGARALARLKARLDVVVSPVEGLRPDNPQDMMRALGTAAHALDRKRRRAPEIRKKLLDATGHMDANLLREADVTSAARRVQLQEQGAQQVGLLDCLTDAQRERLEMFEQLEDSIRDGPPAVQAATWAVLYPMRATERRTAVVDGSRAFEEAKRKLAEQGEDRVQESLRRFQEAYCTTALSERALDADAELEVWKLSSQQELLDAMKTAADAHHRSLLQDVKKAIVTSNDTALDQLNGAVADAEEYQKTRTEIIKMQCKLAESTLAGVCDKGLSTLASRRRRIEHCALKRWADIKEHLEGATAASNASSLLQVGEATQRCVADCHQSLRMPSIGPELQGLEQPQVANALVSGWERLGATMDDRLDFVSQALGKLSDSPETCAVAHGVLCLIDEACKIQIERLKARVEQFQGSLIFSDVAI